MNEELITIIRNFERSGQILFEGKRNIIKIFEYRSLTINVKSFRVPIFINGFIYKNFRKSKAKRSFENAKILISKGIGTPKPIAFYEKLNWLSLRESYYIIINLIFLGTHKISLKSMVIPLLFYNISLVQKNSK